MTATLQDSIAEVDLYAKREHIQPKLVQGKYRTIKWAVLVLTLGVYYGLPWLRWPRAPQEPDQAVLVDFAGSRLYFFGIEIWPDEFYLITGLLVLSALALFFVTSIWGRLWCGYTCPQTVWTDLFIAVERAIEGDRNDRLRLNKAPLSFEKAVKKVSKHGIWLLIAMATGGAWVFYYHDAPSLAQGLLSGDAPTTSYIFIVLLTFTTYALAGLMREQVCIYMCPWPRIQGAMTDSETFEVGYYKLRGEPRGKHKKGQDWSALGDCIDCQACVVACPMGIDIRDGDQLECINCGLCVDACDGIMAKVGLPKGLIAYGSDYDSVAKNEERRRLPKFLRPRTIFYAGALFVLCAFLAFGMGTREDVEFGIERDRRLLATALSDGSVRNALTARILNKKSTEESFTLTAAGPEGLTLGAAGQQVIGNKLAVTIAGDKQLKLRIFITLPPEAQIVENITVSVTDQSTNKVLTEQFRFIRPGDQ